MAGIVNRAISGGLRNGFALADAINERKKLSRLSELADIARGGFDNPNIVNQVGSGLLELGNVNAGTNLLNLPYKRQRQEQEFDALQHQRGIQNQIGMGNLHLRSQELDARLDPNSPFNRKPPTPVSTIGKINQDYRGGFIDESQRNAAVAKANSTKNGITIQHPDGTTTVIGGSGNGLGKSANNQLQTGIIQNHELLDLTDSVRDSFQPEFLTYKGAGEQFFTRHAEKLGMDIGSARKQFLKDRTQFVTKTERLFNAYRKEITGAAAAVQELDRLKKSFLNVDQSPSEFEATLDSYQAELKRTIRLRNKLRREGLDPRTKQGGAMLDNLFLTGGDDDVEARGQELQAQGLSEPEIMETLLREGY